MIFAKRINSESGVKNITAGTITKRQTGFVDRDKSYLTSDDDFKADLPPNNLFNNSDTIYLKRFIGTGPTLPATSEATLFATLEYEMTAELGDGEVAALRFVDVVCASGSGTSLVSEGVDGSLSTGSSAMPGDVNGDDTVNAVFSELRARAHIQMEAHSADVGNFYMHLHIHLLQLDP